MRFPDYNHPLDEELPPWAVVELVRMSPDPRETMNKFAGARQDQIEQQFRQDIARNGHKGFIGFLVLVITYCAGLVVPLFSPWEPMMTMAILFPAFVVGSLLMVPGFLEWKSYRRTLAAIQLRTP